MSIYAQVKEESIEESIAGYRSSIVTQELALDVYDQLSQNDDVLVLKPEDEDELDSVLSRFHRRRVLCGDYHITRNVVLSVDPPLLTHIREKWQRMIDDGVLTIL